MGAEPYEYVVDYHEDITQVLERLRNDVFQSGKYRGSEMKPGTPEEALEMMEESGTASILDINRVSDVPDLCCAAPLSSEELQQYFGKEKPTVEAIQKCVRLWDDLERGQARYLVILENDIPAKIMFIGYSFD